MPLELLFLLLAWAAIIGLLVALPWAVIRLTVGILEADVGKRGVDWERAQPHGPSDEATDVAQHHEFGDSGESDDTVPPATTDADADSPSLEARG